MGTIIKRIEHSDNLTVFTEEGKAVKDDYEKTIREFYGIGPVMNYVLWDLSRCVLDHIESPDVCSIVQTPRPFLSSREVGKTAIVAPSDLAFGLAGCSSSLQLGKFCRLTPLRFEQQMTRWSGLRKDSRITWLRRSG